MGDIIIEFFSGSDNPVCYNLSTGEWVKWSKE